VTHGLADFLDVRGAETGLGGGVSRPRKYGLKGCMPATVSRVEVSSGAGIREAEGNLR
jgi:hypothetical protein